jgi:MFS transporter, ACS family, pantothenate transporter
VPYGPLSMSWANEICGADAEERAIVLGVMNASGYAFNAWLPLLTYPAQQAPRFKKGFIYSTIAFVAQFGITGFVAFLHNRERRMKQMTEEDLEQTPVGIEG